MPPVSVDPIIAAASVMATICFPTLLMFLLYLSFLLHFTCKNLPAPSIYPVSLNKKAIARCFPYFRAEGTAYLGSAVKIWEPVCNCFIYLINSVYHKVILSQYLVNTKLNIVKYYLI